MEFVNHFRGIRKTGRNLYFDLEVAWREYEYIRKVISDEIYNIIINDYKSQKHINDFYCEVVFKDGDIIVFLRHLVLTHTISQIEKLLGIPAIVSTQHANKNIVELRFSKREGVKND